MHNFCKEKDSEACVIKLYLPCCATGIVNIDRSPSGNFEHFLNHLETLLNSISSNSVELFVETLVLIFLILLLISNF